MLLIAENALFVELCEGFARLLRLLKDNLSGILAFFFTFNYYRVFSASVDLVDVVVLSSLTFLVALQLFYYVGI